jgi:hypothetical protein
MGLKVSNITKNVSIEGFTKQKMGEKEKNDSLTVMVQCQGHTPTLDALKRIAVHPKGSSVKVSRLIGFSKL